MPIIERIASALGPVVSIDEHTRNRTMYHYARVLIELDLRKEKEYNIMYEMSGHCTIASVGYEQHPKFCNHCQIVGHSIDNCRSHGNPDGKKTKFPRDGLAKDTTQNKWVRKESTEKGNASDQHGNTDMQTLGEEDSLPPYEDIGAASNELGEKRIEDLRLNWKNTWTTL